MTLRYGAFVVALGMSSTLPLSAQMPWQENQEDLVSVSSLEHACSQDILIADRDCRQAITIAMGAHPIVEEVRKADGSYTHEGKMLPPDISRAGWLGEEACAHAHWDSCMLYVM